MLTVKYIKENYDLVIQGLEKKRFKSINLIKEVIDVDNYRKTSQKNLDDAQAELNNISKVIGELFREGKKDDADRAKRKTGDLKEEIKLLGEKLKESEVALEKLLVQIPNIPHVSVPAGGGADVDNLNDDAFDLHRIFIFVMNANEA
ncbi:MAG: hypothetical protein PHW19_08085 [Salinivirgaceae bacterium]|nr:hypothetical protein [Salinivirgaceae bacterium]